MTPEEREMLLEMPAVLELLAEEREACALAAEAYLLDSGSSARAARRIAAAIRARGEG